MTTIQLIRLSVSVRIFSFGEWDFWVYFDLYFIVVQKTHTINGVNVHTQKALPKDGGQDGGRQGGNFNNNGGNRGGNSRGRHNNFGSKLTCSVA